MYKIRGRAEFIVIATSVILLALILYVLSTSDVLIDLSLNKHSNSIVSVPLHETSSDGNKASARLGVGVQRSRNVAKKYIGLRRDSFKNESNFTRIAMGQQKYVNGAVYYSDRQIKFNDQHNSVLNNRHRIVHIDLKGAPPRIAYFEELFPLLRSLGATGILLEYEDMFPFNGVLKDLAAYNAYTRSDIKYLLKLAHRSELEVIPLIQTFGHLEFLLKLVNFSHLREVPKYPQVICPSNNDTFPVLTNMINQLMELHPHAKHVHIGCDEVYYLGNCIHCGMVMVDQKWTKTQLFLNHVTRVAKYIRKYYPHVMPLTWDDEFRKLSVIELQESGVSEWLEPVIWKYSPDVMSAIGSDVWEKYISVFPTVWIASAFKGATGPDKYVTDISYHLENHQAWVNVINLYSEKIKFQGIVLTGWQRYDHFAILCELLPVGLPSLAVNLAYIQDSNKEFNKLLRQVTEILKCDQPLQFSPGIGLSRCGFPGAGVLDAAERLYAFQQNLDRYLTDSTVKGWLTTYNIDTSFSSPSLVERATSEFDRCKIELISIKKDMITAMSDVFDSYTINEWISTFIQPLDIKLQNLWDAKEKLLAQNYWPKRPLDYPVSKEKHQFKQQS